MPQAFRLAAWYQAKGSRRLISRQTFGEVWPRGQNQYPFARMPAATSFDQGVKGRKTPFSPGTQQKMPAAFFDGAESVGGSETLLMWLGRGRRRCTLT